MSSAGVVIAHAILAEHGSRPDVRLWRCHHGTSWTGKPIRTSDEAITLSPWSRIGSGFVNGVADLLGFKVEASWYDEYHTLDAQKLTARFVAIEVKADGDRVKPEQQAFLDMIERMGGIAIVATCVEDVTAVLGPKP